ncbi:MAG: hypothetical protein HY886_05990 [Deltaproteobacteria bacterium]|nr:hypothetical protein [Deltaproteobacteria bacterium]
MSIQSVKARLLGSYLFLILLFIIQIPIVYLLVVQMSKKYAQIVEVAALRKRSIEINYVLNRHIMNREDALEEVFQTKMAEFDQTLVRLKTGWGEVPPITGEASLDKYNGVMQKWTPMRSTLNAAMDAGDKLRESMNELDAGAFPFIGKLNEIVAGFSVLKDGGNGKRVDVAGAQRMKTMKLAYLLERYARSNDKLDEIGAQIDDTMKDLEINYAALKNGSVALKISPLKDRALLNKFVEAEAVYAKRKALILSTMEYKSDFSKFTNELSNVHTPQMIAATEALTAEIVAGAVNSAMKGVLFMALVLVVSAGCAAFFIWMTNHQVLTPILTIKETVDGFASGDLSLRSGVKVTLLGKELNDEITGLSNSVDSMAIRMSSVIGRITDSSSQLASAAEELAASSTQIASGADKQSGQTVQVASAMEEMNATVVEVAKNSQQVSDAAKSAQDIALKGGTVVNQAVSAMQEVSVSTNMTADTIRKLGKGSEEIGSIVSVINDIADQTNLLALNAAIEAARAGEQGRGFAVVADEVRKLAERTTKATKEISEMIKAIQSETTKAVTAMGEGASKVENGVRLANEAGDSLKSIVKSVEYVSGMITHIATSAEEQSSTTDEITQNMDSIAEVAKGNVAAIAEVSRATTDMARLASELKELVTGFKTRGQGVVVPIRDKPRDAGNAMAGSGLSAASLLTRKG